MARVDYYALQEAVQQTIRDDEDVHAPVLIEEELLFRETDTVVVYLESRTAPEGRQTISGGQRTRFLIRFSIWAFAYSLEGIRAASEQRDDLMGRVEIALMRDRQLKNLAITSWLEGGDFQSALGGEDGGEFMAAGEVVLIADAKAITTVS